MAAMSWLAPGKDVADREVVGNPSIVPEAHAGMMVTPSVKLLRPLGEGGMGAVWVAEHTALRTQVVVKFIASSLKDSKEATERFSREAAAAAQVRSPHVVQTFDHGFTSDGTPYIVMELLEGNDLGHFLEQHGPMSPALVVEVIAQLSRALDRAHERGIVHRDIKPGNIFLCDAGGGDVFVKLLDFGIAKGVDVPQLDSGTKTGAMIGSPFYMSPEQILGSKSVDHRSDLWSVGVVAYEALTGKKPFDAETMGGLAIRIHSEPLPLITASLPALSPAVDVWFQKACSRPAPDRFSTAKEMAEALAAALGGEMPRGVELPRSSTGANRDVTLAHEPTLATTESGVSTRTTTPPPSTRNRILMLGAVGAVLAAAAFAGVSQFKKGNDPRDGRPLTAEPASALPSAAPLPLPLPAASAPPTKLSEIPAPTPSPPAPAVAVPKPTHGKPASASPSAHPPLPSATATAPAPPPAATGHDIF